MPRFKTGQAKYVNAINYSFFSCTKAKSVIYILHVVEFRIILTILSETFFSLRTYEQFAKSRAHIAAIYHLEKS